jgi:hypothetical protein
LGKIEVLFNGDEVLDEFEYGTTSDWIEVQPGVVRGTIRRDRGGINYVVFDAIAPVVANEDYEMIISDLLVIPAPVDRDPLRENTARVRAIHASVDTPPIDVAVKGDGGRIEEVTSTLNYAERSDALVIPGGAYDVEVRLHDTGEVLLTQPQIALEAGMTSDLVVYGTPGDANAPLAVATLSDEVRTSQAATATP